MHSFSATLAAELDNAGHDDLFTLLEIQTATPVYLCSDGRSITHEGITYVPWDFRFGSIGGTLTQTSPTVPLRLLNVTHPTTGAARPWSTTAASESLNGLTVNVREVLLTDLDDTTSQIPETGWITNRPRFVGDWLELQLGPPQNLGRIETPVPMLRAPRCRFQYQGQFCRSESGLATCPGKTVGECITRHGQDAVRISQPPYNAGDLARRTG